MITILLTILATGLAVELVGYFWHKHVAHLGVGGETIRHSHYIHHEVDYPHEGLETEHYKVGLFQGDTWPWLIPASAFFAVIGLGYLVGLTSGLVTTTAILWTAFHIYAISYIHNSYHIKDHWLNSFEEYRKNKILHNIHHYYNCNYGISNYWADRVFGTIIDKYIPSEGKQDIFPGHTKVDSK